MKRQELIRKTGSLQQVASVRPLSFREGRSASLQAVELMCRRVGDTRQLQAVTTARSHRRDNAQLNTLYRILSAHNAHGELLGIDVTTH